MKTYAFIFARGGSKGVPGKNIRDFAGKPLLVHSIDVAQQIEEIDHFFVSTDSEAIAEVAESSGATVIPRPEELARDNSPEWLAWQHAIQWVQGEKGDFDRFISLPATAPLRLAEDVYLCLNKLDENTDFIVTMERARRSPWFNMVKQDTEGFVDILLDGNDKIARRQDTPDSFDLTTVAYVTRPGFIMNNQSIWDGRVQGVVVPHERAIDIDTELDFEIAEYLMKKRGLQVKPLC